MKTLLLPIITGAALGLTAAAASAQTLDEVKSRGYLQCGANTGLPGFGNPDDQGNWTGFDIDTCRAIAAAIFDDPEAVRFTPLSAPARFTALQSGEVDVLARNTTWTMSRDTELGLNFAPVTYYDGQGFMVRRDLGVASAAELEGASVCTQTGTTTELNLEDYFRRNNMQYEVVALADQDATLQAYDQGRCDAFTTDASGLYASRLELANPDEHLVLPEIISKEPLAPAVRHGDDQWFDIVKWTVYAMIYAEELGVTSENVEEMLTSENPEIRRLLGVEGSFGPSIGLEPDWAVRIIRHVGNYGESFERNLGVDTPLQIERGLNALWTDGGLQYAIPIR